MTSKVRGEVERLEPAWRRVTEGEHRWPATIAIAGMIVLQSRLPEQLSLVTWWVLPALEAAILTALVLANPGRMGASGRALHGLSLTLIAVVMAASIALYFIVLRGWSW